MSDLNALLPGSLTIAFPRTDNGAPSPNLYPYVVTLTALALPELAGISGHSGSRPIHASALATCSGGGTPTNDAELLALARQLATDWYRFQVGNWDVVYAGSVPWTPDALTDVIEWTYRKAAFAQEGAHCTRARRGPWDVWPAELWYYGTGGSAGSGQSLTVTDGTTTDGGCDTLTFQGAGTATVTLTRGSGNSLGNDTVTVTTPAAPGSTSIKLSDGSTSDILTGSASLTVVGTGIVTVARAGSGGNDTLTINAASGSTSPGGVQGNVQVNYPYGTFAGFNAFVYDPVSGTLTLSPGSSTTTLYPQLNVGLLAASAAGTVVGVLNMGNGSGGATTLGARIVSTVGGVSYQVDHYTGTGSDDLALSLLSQDGMYVRGYGVLNVVARLPGGHRGALQLWSLNSGSTSVPFGFQAPDASASATTGQVWQLPLTDGTVNQVWATDGSGNLDFIDLPASPIKASADLTGRTAAVASVTTYTPGALSTFRVSGYVTITAIAVDVLQLQVTYTDETAASRTQTFFPQGLTSANLATVGAISFPSLDIRAAAGSAITVKTVLTVGGGSITYDVGACIEQVR